MRVDDAQIADEEISHLIKIGHENSMQREKMSSNPKYHRTEYENELAFRFLYNYEHISTQKCQEFEDLYSQACTESNLELKIKLLKQTVEKYYKVKKWHYCKSKGARLHFEDMWENLHNSKNDWFSWVPEVESRLIYYEYQYNYVRPRLLEIIKNNNGILQKNIYPYIDCDQKQVQGVIRDLVAEDIIVRVKKSNSYYLSISNDTQHNT